MVEDRGSYRGETSLLRPNHPDHGTALKELRPRFPGTGLQMALSGHGRRWRYSMSSLRGNRELYLVLKIHVLNVQELLTSRFGEIPSLGPLASDDRLHFQPKLNPCESTKKISQDTVLRLGSVFLQVPTIISARH